MKFARLFFIFALLIAAAVSVAAQEGHPLTGTWYGDFGMTAGQRNDLTVILKWDGSNVSGLVNPGPNVVPIKSARMDVKLTSPLSVANAVVKVERRQRRHNSPFISRWTRKAKPAPCIISFSMAKSKIRLPATEPWSGRGHAATPKATFAFAVCKNCRRGHRPRLQSVIGTPERSPR